MDKKKKKILANKNVFGQSGGGGHFAIFQLTFSRIDLILQLDQALLSTFWHATSDFGTVIVNGKNVLYIKQIITLIVQQHLWIKFLCMLVPGRLSLLEPSVHTTEIYI